VINKLKQRTKSIYLKLSIKIKPVCVFGISISLCVQFLREAKKICLKEGEENYHTRDAERFTRFVVHIEMLR